MRGRSKTANKMASKSAVIVIAMKGFQDLELAGTVKGLKHHKIPFVICGKEKDVEAEGKLGGKQLVSLAMKEVNVSDFDRVAFIGGPGAKALADDPDAIRLAKEFTKAGKIVGAICIAPTILASAGVLKGIHSTVWDSKGGSEPEAKYISEHGAKFVPERLVVVDGNFITGNGPGAADEFGETFAKMG